MYDYTEEFEDYQKSDGFSNRPDGWSKFFITHKEDEWSDSGYMRVYTHRGLAEQKQIVYNKGDKWEISVVIEDGYDSNVTYHKVSLETPEEAVRLLKDFTYEDFMGDAFDSVAASCALEMVSLFDIDYGDAVSLTKRQVHMNHMDRQEKRVALEEAYNLFGERNG